MFLHQLHDPNKDVFVTHPDSGYTYLIAKGSSAVFQFAPTRDILNIALATGNLFQDGWRLSTVEEIVEFHARSDDRFVRPRRSYPLIKGRPELTVVDGGKRDDSPPRVQQER